MKLLIIWWILEYSIVDAHLTEVYSALFLVQRYCAVQKYNYGHNTFI